MVPATFRQYVILSCQVAEAQRLTPPSARREPPPSMSFDADRRCRDIRFALQCRGLSPAVADIISGSWQPGTRKQYKYAWEKWLIWNSIRFANPFQTTECIVVQYLHYLLTLKKSYSVLNTHKAMLLQTLPFFGNYWCKQGTMFIARFMKGVFCRSPPKPRYIFTWDVTVVLNFLSKLFPLEGLSLKLLTLKTVALIALAAAPRAQTLVSMVLDHMLVENKVVIFMFPNLLKTTRVGHSFVLRIEHFQDESLCAMHTLLYYIKVTKQFRKSRSVFVSYVTYNAVCTSTVARWLKLVLHSAGINTDRFKAHSYRSASVSAAFARGCSLKGILDTADWSSDKTFRQFYCRQSLSTKQVRFADAVCQL